MRHELCVTGCGCACHGPKPHSYVNESGMRVDRPYAGDTTGPIRIWGYDQTASKPNPPLTTMGGEVETYAPVALKWVVSPVAPEYAYSPMCAIGKRGARVYGLSTDDNGRGYSIRVNGVNIPVQFVRSADAMAFAQAIEDANTED